MTLIAVSILCPTVQESVPCFAAGTSCDQSNKRGSQEEIIQVGDLVLIHIENVPRSSWKLAIVNKVLRGSDALVRAAEMKTNSGVISRSINLLYPLEVTRRILRNTLRN